MTDLAAFVRAVAAGDLDARGPFADWLDERGDPRGKLLRRRWRKWRLDRDAEEARLRLARKSVEDALRGLVEAMTTAAGEVSFSCDVAFADDGPERCDASLKEYVRRRFPGGTP